MWMFAKAAGNRIRRVEARGFREAAREYARLEGLGSGAVVEVRYRDGADVIRAFVELV